MITTILFIVILYILNIFITRYLNYYLYKINDSWGIHTFVWFIPIAGPIALLLILLVVYPKIDLCKKNWFTGKYW